MAPLVIAPRFGGPPDSGNGGYVCGLIADRLDRQAEITLRAPPPLATPMTVERAAGGSVRVRHGRTLIAEGTCLPGGLDVEPPGPVPLSEARTAGARSRLRTHPDEHPFPSCFVCGPHRQPGDGLRILVGPVAGRDLSADVWYPDQSLARQDGDLRPEFVWAALDCSGAIGAIGDAAFLDDLRRIDAQLLDAQKKLDVAVRASGTTLTSIFGVGPVVAATVIGAVRDVSRFPDRDHFAAYNGTAPIEVSSGPRKIYRLSRRGNRRLNHVIHMAAVTQIRYRHSDGRAYYERKLAEGKTPKEALRALKRRVSDAIYGRLQADTRRTAASPR